MTALLLPPRVFDTHENHYVTISVGLAGIVWWGKTFNVAIFLDSINVIISSFA